MYEEVIARHSKIALQFSGGKDSLAVLLLMREHWDKLTVYFVNSGNPFPETMGLIAAVKNMVPHFVEIQGRQPRTLKELGMPSDLITSGSTWAGRMLGSDEPGLIDRYTCCFKSIMEPMYERMKADEITLIIRGQKNKDGLKPPLRSGDTSDGVEFLYPIEDWDDAKLYGFLVSSGIPIPQYYRDGMTSAPDCMNCTAWLEHKMPAYVKKYHPEQYKELNRRLNQIAVVVKPYIDQLGKALE